MKTVVLLAALVAVLYAKTFTMKTHNAGSLRAKLISSGKYHQYLSAQYLRRAQILATGSQPFIDFYDDIYMGNITLGSPPQPVTVMLDTGSSNLWVIDAACNSDACNGYPSSGFSKLKFDTQKSSSFKKETRRFSIEYGSGSCNGYLGKDTLSFGELNVPIQEFGVATHLAEIFGYQPLSGILGLGWPRLAVDNVIPPMQNVLSQLDKPIFTVWLDRKIKMSHGGNAGLITYGALDTTNCEEHINYVPLSSETYWQFPIQGFSLGSYSTNKKYQVISDTGTSWIGAPISIVNAVVEQLEARYDWENELYTVPCTTMRTQPDLTFTINGVTYKVPSVEYILDLQLGNNKCVLTFFAMNSGGFGPTWILGDTWIRTYCNIHDIGNKQIGFAKAIHSKL